MAGPAFQAHSQIRHDPARLSTQGTVPRKGCAMECKTVQGRFRRLSGDGFGAEMPTARKAAIPAATGRPS